MPKGNEPLKQLGKPVWNEQWIGQHVDLALNKSSKMANLLVN